MADTALIQAPAQVVDEALYEVVDGRIVETPCMGVRETLVASWLIRLLNTSEVANGLGLVISEVLINLDPARGLKRRPDVAFVTFERWPRRSPVPDGDAWDVIPDLAVEVVSPSNTAAEVMDKLDEYFRAGVRLVWVIYPVQQKVYAYRSPTDVRILQPGDDLEGGAVLPTLRLPVGTIFGDDGGDVGPGPITRRPSCGS